MDFGFLDESSGADQYDFAPVKSPSAPAAAASTSSSTATTATGAGNKETKKEEKRKEDGTADECACRYCGVRDAACLVMCSECRRWFCNGRGGMSASHIVQHLVRAKHKEIALHRDAPAGGAPIECYNCGTRNVFTLGYVPATSTSVVVLLCREPCAALGHDRCVRNPEWDLSKWAPLVCERSLVSWLAAAPPAAAAPRFFPRLSDILRLEAAWRLGHPHATYRDLPALPTVEEMEQEARFAAATAAQQQQQQQPLPQSTSASGMLGVITLASGNKRPVSASEAPSLIRRLPLVDTITGSTTMFSAACARSDSAIATTFNADDTMPIFTAPGRMSSNTASISCTTNSLGTSSTPETPRVFCAVSAVIAVWANSPNASMVFKSA